MQRVRSGLICLIALSCNWVSQVHAEEAVEDARVPSVRKLLLPISEDVAKGNVSVHQQSATNAAVIRQAEAKFEAALKTADAQLQDAHEQYLKRVKEARQQLLTDLAAARSSVKPTPPAPTVGKANALPVSVPGHVAKSLVEGDDSAWSNVPKVVRGAVIFMPPKDAPKDGIVEFAVKHDALIGLAASWAYDGNASGGWQQERMTKEQLIASGWVESGKMYLNRTDRHTIFLRHCKKGETFRIRTRKYYRPCVLVPDVFDAAAQQKPEAADVKVAVQVLGAKATPAEQALNADKMPKALVGTMMHDSGVTGVAIVNVHRGTKLFVAASWAYDGNASGQWTEERWMKEDFKKAGWQEIGTVEILHRGNEQEHVLFSRHCKKGERFRLRSRKYGAPFVFVPMVH